MERLLGTLMKKYYQNKSTPTYFGIGNDYLDVITMRYRVFGAVWQLHNGYRYIIGYWFGDNKKDILNFINCGRWAKLVDQEGQIEEVYHMVREKQEKELWKKRIKLPNNIKHQENWIEKKTGWYIIKSYNHFPCTLTCIQKTKYNIWIEHICVCESNNDIKKLLNLINLEHNIKLIPDEFINCM
ncbi:hypothetical protein ABES02_28385 [Neobacillus pocheonensis]|uniref:hypothetical protein n=1 Tax=Neobacillus pocheonensis TaxID=363869 RepID=UPI003D27BBAA